MISQYTYTIHLYNTLIQYTYTIHLYNTLIQYTYTMHVYNTLIRYTNSIHLYNTLIQYTHTIHLYNTLIQYTYTMHVYNTLIRYTNSIHLYNTLIQYTHTIHLYMSNFYILKGRSNERCTFLSSCDKIKGVSVPNSFLALRIISGSWPGMYIGSIPVSVSRNWLTLVSGGKWNRLFPLPTRK